MKKKRGTEQAGGDAPSDSASPPPSVRGSGNFWATVALAAAIIICAVAAYQPSMRGAFLWDDGVGVFDNPLLVKPGGLPKIWFTAEPYDYFPLTYTVFWLEWRLWGGNTFGYHVVSVLLHGISAVLLWFALKRLRIPGAWLAGLLFALHPVAVASVSWISELKNTLSMAFFLASVLLYARFETSSRRRWYFLSLAAFLLALLSKTSVVILPVVLIGWAWWQRGKVARKDIMRSASFFLLAIALGLVTIWFQKYRALVGGMPTPIDPLGVRLASAGCAVWFYLYKALLPINLFILYPRWEFRELSALSFVPLALIPAALLVLWRYRNGWARPFLAAFVYCTAAVAPACGVIPMSFMDYSRVGDHLQYLALPGAVALVVGLTWGGFRSGRWRAYAAVGAVGVAALLFHLTARQAACYKDELALWQTAVDQNPEFWMTRNNLGNALNRRGRGHEAIPHFEKALKIRSNYPEPHYNLGIALFEEKRFDEALAHFKEAVRIQPGEGAFQDGLAGALFAVGKRDEAEAAYRAAIALKPDYAPLHYNFGILLKGAGRGPEAISQFNEALRVEPRFFNAYFHRGNALMSEKRYKEAAADFQQFLRVVPNQVEAYGQLGKALLLQGDVGGAVANWERALQIRGDLLPVLMNLAWVRATHPDPRIRNGDKAALLARRACELSGGNPRAYDALGAACAEQGRFDEAVENARKALESARAQGAAEYAADVERRVELYRARKPFHEGAGGP